MSRKRKCPCCGYFTLEGERGNYDICPVCYWEDDPAMEEDPTFAGGANGVSLRRARKNYKRYGAMEKRFVSKVREPRDEEKSDEVEEKQ